MLKQPMVAMKLVGIPESVAIQLFTQYMDNGVFKGSEAFEKAGTVMLDELARWTEALAVLRK